MGVHSTMQCSISTSFACTRQVIDHCCILISARSRMAKAAAKAVRYFERHAHCMAYGHFWEQGCFVGSGTTKSEKNN